MLLFKAQIFGSTEWLAANNAIRNNCANTQQRTHGAIQFQSARPPLLLFFFPSVWRLFLLLRKKLQAMLSFLLSIMAVAHSNDATLFHNAYKYILRDLPLKAIWLDGVWMKKRKKIIISKLSLLPSIPRHSKSKLVNFLYKYKKYFYARLGQERRNIIAVKWLIGMMLFCYCFLF